ncbi:MAG TPA: hypothetical protein VLF71_04975 [Candidatus Saccharimonadales bacterium]|nr:hypothetical protein [Candidatus Saccharimonadales bacterium]
MYVPSHIFVPSRPQCPTERFAEGLNLVDMGLAFRVEPLGDEGFPPTGVVVSGDFLAYDEPTGEMTGFVGIQETTFPADSPAGRAALRLGALLRSELAAHWNELGIEPDHPDFDRTLQTSTILKLAAAFRHGVLTCPGQMGGECGALGSWAVERVVLQVAPAEP